MLPYLGTNVGDVKAHLARVSLTRDKFKAIATTPARDQYGIIGIRIGRCDALPICDVKQDTLV